MSNKSTSLPYVSNNNKILTRLFFYDHNIANRKIFLVTKLKLKAALSSLHMTVSFINNKDPTETSLCRYRSVTDISVSVFLFSDCTDIKTAWKNVWTSDLKWSNYVVCPAEGSLLFNNY